MIDWDSPSGCWYLIPGHPDHAVTESGQVLSVRSGTILKPWPNSAGYPVVRLAPSKRNRLVHRLVALTFYGPQPEGMEVRHLNGDKTDPSAANLAYGTREENMADRWVHGTHPAQRVDSCSSCGQEYPPAERGQVRVCPTCRAVAKAKYVRRQGGARVTCDQCGREVSKLNLGRHQKTDYCNGRVTARWQ